MPVPLPPADVLDQLDFQHVADLYRGRRIREAEQELTHYKRLGAPERLALLLAASNAGPGLTPRDLARYTGNEPRTVQRQLDFWVERGLLHRTATTSPPDGQRPTKADTVYLWHDDPRGHRR